MDLPLPSTPRISAVVLFGGRTGDLRDWLHEAVPRCSTYGVEFLAIGPSTPAGIHPVAVEFPTVRFIVPPPGGAGERTFRRIGMTGATGDIVVFIDVQNPSGLDRLLALIRSCHLKSLEDARGSSNPSTDSREDDAALG